MFAALLSPDAQAATLPKLRDMWAALAELEKAMVDSTSLKQLHKALIWPRSCWVRELMIGLVAA